MSTVTELINQERFWYLGPLVELEGKKCIDEINVSELIDRERGVKVIAELIASRFGDTNMTWDLIMKAPDCTLSIMQATLMYKKKLGDDFIQLCMDTLTDVHDLTLPWLKDHTFLKYLIDKNILDVRKFTKSAIYLGKDLESFDDVFRHWKVNPHPIVASVVIELSGLKNPEESPNSSKYKEEYFKRCHEYLEKLR